MTYTDTTPSPRRQATTEPDWTDLDERAHLQETRHQTIVVQHTISLNSTLQRTTVPDAVREFLLEI